MREFNKTSKSTAQLNDIIFNVFFGKLLPFLKKRKLYLVHVFNKW